MRNTTEPTYRFIDPPCYAAARYLQSFAFIFALFTEFRKLYQVQEDGLYIFCVLGSTTGEASGSEAFVLVRVIPSNF